METLVIMPTYNEKENIAEIVGAVLKLGSGIEMLVIDDNSPDGTGGIVDSMAAVDPRVHVIHRPGKLGLGSAYITGFKWALANTDAKYVFEMDADFSHDPNAIPQFLEAIATNDLVIGSRYIRGISVVNWPLEQAHPELRREQVHAFRHRPSHQGRDGRIQVFQARGSRGAPARPDQERRVLLPDRSQFLSAGRRDSGSWRSRFSSSTGASGARRCRRRSSGKRRS